MQKMPYVKSFRASELTVVALKLCVFGSILSKNYQSVFSVLKLFFLAQIHHSAYVEHHTIMPSQL